MHIHHFYALGGFMFLLWLFFVYLQGQQMHIRANAGAITFNCALSLQTNPQIQINQALV